MVCFFLLSFMHFNNQKGSKLSKDVKSKFVENIRLCWICWSWWDIFNKVRFWIGIFLPSILVRIGYQVDRLSLDCLRKYFGQGDILWGLLCTLINQKGGYKLLKTEDIIEAFQECILSSRKRTMKSYFLIRPCYKFLLFLHLPQNYMGGLLGKWPAETI